MRGDITINGQDAYTAWGISLEASALSALMTPAPMKDPITNASRLEHGKRVIIASPKKADRDLSLTLNITARTEADFLAKYASFCEELATGKLDVSTRYQPGVTYHLVYLSCAQFSEFQRNIGKFVLRVNEPNPDDRA